MSEQTPEEPKSEEVNLDNYVPKTDHDSELKAKEDEITKMKNDLDQANLQLLDPKYLDFLEDKKKGTPKPTKSATNKEDLPPEIGSVREELSEEIEALKEQNKGLQTALWDMLATQELEATRGKYSDFSEYEADIKTFLQNAQKDYTFEEAYLLVKSTKGEAPQPSGKAPTNFSSEKPTSTVPAKSLEQKNFKTVAEADQATVRSLKDKYPDLDEHNL